MGLPKWSESYVQDLEADCRRGSGPRMERRQGGESLAMMGRVFQEDFQSLCDLPAVASVWSPFMVSWSDRISDERVYIGASWR